MIVFVWRRRCIHALCKVNLHLTDNRRQLRFFGVRVRRQMNENFRYKTVAYPGACRGIVRGHHSPFLMP